MNDDPSALFESRPGRWLVGAIVALVVLFWLVMASIGEEGLTEDQRRSATETATAEVTAVVPAPSRSLQSDRIEVRWADAQGRERMTVITVDFADDFTVGQSVEIAYPVHPGGRAFLDD